MAGYYYSPPDPESLLESLPQASWRRRSVSQGFPLKMPPLPLHPDQMAQYWEILRSTPFEALVLHSYTEVSDHLVISIPVFLYTDTKREDFFPVWMYRGEDVLDVRREIIKLRVALSASEVVEHLMEKYPCD